MTHTTRIITAPSPGGPEALRVETRELAPARPGEVLIDVAAAGVNRPDVFERMGLYPPPPGAPEGLGLEVSGHVRETGEGVTHVRPGDPVVALTAGGGYADIARADAGCVLPAPEGVDLIHAAGLPETVFTVWSNVFDRARLQPGERFLVHGGASGIGTTAIQMAKAHGAHVIATAGTAEKCDLCRQLGADLALNYRTDDWVPAVKDFGGADVILDMVGGDYAARNLSVLNTDGRLVMIAFLQGARGARSDAGHAQASDAHRLHPAQPPGWRKGGDRQRRARSGLAMDRRRQAASRDRFGVCGGRRRQSPCPHGRHGACREDFADALTARLQTDVFIAARAGYKHGE